MDQNLQIKNCPFCKKEINKEQTECPNCRRILVERIDRNKNATIPLVLIPNHNKNINQDFFHKKPSDMINDLKKYKKQIYIIVILFLVFLIGRVVLFSYDNDQKLLVERKELAIQKIINNHEMHFKIIADSVSANVRSVAKSTGQTHDYRGRLVNNYIYKNNDLSMSIFETGWSDTNNEYINLKTNIEKYRLDYEKQLDIIFNCFKTDYFFIANELWARAYENNDVDKMQILYDKIISTVNDESFKEYLFRVDSVTSTVDLMDGLYYSIETVKLAKQIKNVSSYLEGCIGLEDCPNYNDKVEQHNLLVGKLKLRSVNEDRLFSKFMNLVDAFILFPGQDTIEQTTSTDN